MAFSISPNDCGVERKGGGGEKRERRRRRLEEKSLGWSGSRDSIISFVGIEIKGEETERRGE